MRVGSLFSGIGGFDLGLERAGMEIAWQSEIDSFCCRVLAHHWPGVTNHGDITQIDPRDLEPVDLVCGGFPCQDLSIAGRRAGLAGARSGLWWEFHRILAGLRPRWVVIENVPGLLSSNSGRDMGTLLASLGDLGYGWAYRVLDAQWFGLAQRRKRVFIVGRLGDRAAAAQVLFEPESRSWNPPPRREAGKVAATIPASGAGTSRTGNERTEADLLVTQALTGTFANGGADDNKAQDGFSVAIQDVRGGTRHRTDHGQGIGIRDDGLCYTLSATERHGVVQAMAVRRLTPRECERLQGFPDDWTAIDGENTPDSPRYRALGNAVAVPVAEWIGRRILAVEATTTNTRAAAR